MNIYERFASMFTTLNVACLLFIYPIAPPAIKDLLRGTSLIILFMVATIWFSGHLFEVYDELFAEFAEPQVALLMKFSEKTEFVEKPLVSQLMNFAKQSEFAEPILAEPMKFSQSVKRAIVFGGDILFHILPGHLIGLPTNPVSILIAYCITLMWFFLNRERITMIYSRSITKKRVEKSLIFVGIMAILFVMFWMFL